jgi:hypothetical protein
MQDACGITDATGIHRHIHDLLLDLRGWTSVSRLQEKRPPTPEATLPAPGALFAFRRCAVAYNIRPMAVGTVEDLRYRGSLSYGWFCSAQTPKEESTSTDLKHLPRHSNGRNATCHTPIVLPCYSW